MAELQLANALACLRLDPAEAFCFATGIVIAADANCSFGKARKLAALSPQTWQDITAEGMAGRVMLGVPGTHAPRLFATGSASIWVRAAALLGFPAAARFGEREFGNRVFVCVENAGALLVADACAVRQDAAKLGLLPLACIVAYSAGLRLLTREQAGVTWASFVGEGMAWLSDSAPALLHDELRARTLVMEP